MENCVTCRSPFFSAVHFCPYCGKDLRPGGLSEATPAAAAVRVPEPASEPVPAPAPAPVEEAAPASPAPAAPPQPAPASSPAPAAPGPALQAAAPFAPATPALRDQPPPPKNRKALVAAAVMVCLAAVFFMRTPAQTDTAACAQVYETGKRALAQGDEANARAQLERAAAVCGIDSAEARDLGARIEAVSNKALAEAACDTQLGQIREHLGESDLAAARKGLEGLDRGCAAGSAVRPLKQQLARQARAAAEASERASQLIGQQDSAGASQAIDRLEQADRSHPDIARLHADLKRIGESVGAVELPEAPDLPDEPAALPRVRPVAPAPVQAPAAAAQMQAQVPARVQAQMQAQMEAQMAQGFLRDAERALARGQFDAARTYIDSARRVDPSNKQADALAQTVRERERQVLQNETTIR